MVQKRRTVVLIDGMYRKGQTQIVLVFQVNTFILRRNRPQSAEVIKSQIAIGNHQFYGVSFGYKIPAKETLRLRPILGVVSLGNSYNQTQQQQ
jgi:hypothetical protein